MAVVERLLVGRSKDKAEAACKQTVSDTPSTHGGRAAFRIPIFANDGVYVHLEGVPGLVPGFSFALFYNETVKPSTDLDRT